MSQLRAPRQKLNRKLAVAVYGSGRRLYDLAAAAGFSSYTDASAALNADVVRATPLMVTRLRVLATLVGFPPDEVLLGEVVEPVHREAFSVRNLPRPRS